MAWDRYEMRARLVSSAQWSDDDRVRVKVRCNDCKGAEEPWTAEEEFTPEQWERAVGGADVLSGLRDKAAEHEAQRHAEQA